MRIPPFSSPGLLLAGAVTLTALALWLLLPRSSSTRAARGVGYVFGTVALVAFIMSGRRMGCIGDEVVFSIVSIVAVVSGAATILTRSPVYSAIWFALSLAGVSGVLLVLGAQFLGVATIVVYAGAILVMFLFVLMLAQPSGLAPYDRVSNEPFLSAVSGAVLLGLLSLVIGRMSLNENFSESSAFAGFVANNPALLERQLLQDDHVARLGSQMFGRHLVSVEVAGVLLLVSLIGSIAIVSRNTESQSKTLLRGGLRDE
ncbi:MAG: NADH-quinone oxidoreductase subunit J [Planctomycetota bacterium]|nr:NADH-quinone oxidoreductase subunit J [Planctomycetia bacterium]MDO7677354.1 NADH-quinone oxidoreductase subunit J [Pirellulales bacterium]RLS30258.1 MAG: hypothetical protein DWH80_11350 [Planctomycetota bacterium]TSA09281.1 MAG: hypothetical protein D4R77_01290 [Planctomycetaceae bacterium]